MYLCNRYVRKNKETCADSKIIETREVSLEKKRLIVTKVTNAGEKI